jgi:hypothetical protein
MASNSVSIAWLLPFMTLAPMGLGHCMASAVPDDPADSGSMKASPDDAGMKMPEDGGTKTLDDSGMKMLDDGGMKTLDDGSAKQPGDDAASPTDDGGPTATPDAGGSPHDPGSVVCNGAPCDVAHGSVCCVTLTWHGPTETCNPPHSVCQGHAVECDEQADCNSGVCCQDFPSGGMVGSASCRTSCDAHICR